jgi:L-ascorbate metabolism protein UlaG (beta-lactamase superfamily)
MHPSHGGREAGPDAPGGGDSVQLTKFGHSCVRLAARGASLVIDPGTLSEAESVHDADAVLVTHEHFDHFSESRLRYACALNPGLEIFSLPSICEALSDLGTGSTPSRTGTSSPPPASP